LRTFRLAERLRGGKQMPKVTPDAKDIVQGSTRKAVLGQKRVSVLSSLLSEDMSKPQTDFDLGVRDGRVAALTEFKSGGSEYPKDYEEYEKGRKLARNAIGAVLGLTPEPEYPEAVAVGSKKAKKGKK